MPDTTLAAVASENRSAAGALTVPDVRVLNAVQAAPDLCTICDAPISREIAGRKMCPACFRGQYQPI